MKRYFDNEKLTLLMLEVFKSGLYSSRYGDMVHRFEQAFAEMMGVNFAVAVNSGTSALHVALLACGIGPGDEVIVPCLGPTMTAAAVCLTGAKPVFADIEHPGGYCMSPNSFRSGTATLQTKAVIPVHIFGNSCQMDEIVKIAQYKRHVGRDMKFYNRNPVFVIEDCAQMIKPSNSVYKLEGDIACYSFEQSKQICCGDGGMAITNDPVLAERMRQFSDNGAGCVTASDGRWKGPIGIDCIGHNYRMSELTAAVGLSQIDDFPEKMWAVQHRPDDADKFEKKLIDFGVTYNRKPWDKLVYEWPIFGGHEGLCPIAESIYPNLFVFPITESKKLKKVEAYVG